MSKIIVYTANLCGYCVMAKRLLDTKGVAYTEINVDAEPGLREALMQKSKRRTVPQIYIGEQHIGGFDDLVALDRQKNLDPLLTAYKVPPLD